MIQEDHDYWIDTQITYEVRPVCSSSARRLAANGSVDSPDDVFHLRLEELRRPLAPTCRAVVAERRGEMERFSAVASPPVLGVLPPGPPPDDPVSRRGDQDVRRAPAGVGERRRAPRAGRLARRRHGPARVVHSLAEAEALAARRGPRRRRRRRRRGRRCSRRAAAVVTDTGGILSHCAVVAREYAIPAVVGTARRRR